MDPPEDPLHIDLPPDPPNPPNPDLAQISFHSLLGHLAPETLCLLGSTGKQQVLILVDAGSTHNFIQESLAHQLGLASRATAPLKVMMGNGQFLHYHHLCESVPVVIQSITFIVDLHLLPLCSANMVLGVQWLKYLGLVLTDYNMLSIKFSHEGRLVELQGDVDCIFHLFSPPQLRCLICRKSVSAYFHISLIPKEPPLDQTLSTQFPPDISHILKKYQSLFQPPQSLPPSRPTNHHIHLLPNSKPINVRPYRYPHFQKNEIEAQVK